MERKLILYDIDKNMCNAWKKYFKDTKNVEIKNCSFEDLESEYVVTAGNSYGIMSGGLDLAVRGYYGQSIQDLIQLVIVEQYNGFLSIGESIVIHTEDPLKENLIYAPTMRLPQKSDITYIFYVFSKLLQKYNNFACPGLCTATGGIPVDLCAKIMKDAYDYIENFI